MAITAPLPDYPYEAKRRNLTGSGICVVTVDTATGTVTNATMFQSTGSPLLDKLTIQTFKSWRFKPGTVSQVRVPISYGMRCSFRDDEFVLVFYASHSSTIWPSICTVNRRGFIGMKKSGWSLLEDLSLTLNGGRVSIEVWRLASPVKRRITLRCRLVVNREAINVKRGAHLHLASWSLGRQGKRYERAGDPRRWDDNVSNPRTMPSSVVTRPELLFSRRKSLPVSAKR